MITHFATSTVDFRGPWTQLMDNINVGGVLNLLAIIGVVMVVGSLAMWIYRKTRGGGGNTSGLVWMIVFGGLLAAPAILVPAVLFVIEGVINIIVAVLKSLN